MGFGNFLADNESMSIKKRSFSLEIIYIVETSKNQVKLGKTWSNQVKTK